jgi:hypothetical protein
MILYINGDSHSAGAETANGYCFAQDDSQYWDMARQPHPDNLKLSYGQHIATALNYKFHCDAESAASNSRIIRTTEQYLQQYSPDLVIIGWSTWEREEWLHDGVYYQVTASGSDSVPDALKLRYRQWVIEQNNATRQEKMLHWHEKIHQLHQTLNQQQIPHVFFNCYSDFSAIKHCRLINGAVNPGCLDWRRSYVDPYSTSGTYYQWLTDQGFQAHATSYHHGATAHQAWAQFLLDSWIDKFID